MMALLRPGLCLVSVFSMLEMRGTGRTLSEGVAAHRASMATITLVLTKPLPRDTRPNNFLISSCDEENG